MLDRFAVSSLRGQILTRTLIVVVVPLVALAVVAVLGLRALTTAGNRQADDTRRILIEETVPERLLSEAETTSREIELLVMERVGDVEGWARQPTMVALAAGGDSSDAERFLTTELDRLPTFRRALVTDATGSTVGRVGDVDDGSHRQEEWWAAAVDTGVHVGEIVLLDTGDPDDAAPIAAVPIAARIENGDGRALGVLRTWLDVGFVTGVADADAGDGIEITVLTDGRHLLAETATDHDPSRLGVDTVPFDQLSLGIAEALVTDTGSTSDDDGFHAFAPVDVSFEPNDSGEGLHATWHVVVTQSRASALAPLDGLSDLNDDLGRAGWVLILVVVVMLVVATAVAVLTALSLSRRIIDPIEALTRRADRAAHTDLPEAVRSLRSGQAPDDPERARIERVDAADTELRQLADAFNSVQETAVRLAGEQAEQRTETAAMFANLGRRSQSLAKRQIDVLQEIGAPDDDAALAGHLFKVDHLATRMRRNAESLLVIAGQRSSTGRPAPARLEEVVDRAVKEVEHHERIDRGHIEPTALLGQVATDVSHLVAELLDNALAFSPPDTSVAITGMLSRNQYLLSIVDQGIGMTAEELVRANERLGSGSDLELGSSRQLGFLVAARLADRHGIRVRVQEAADRGTVALVVLPEELLRPVEDRRRTDAPPATPGSSADQRVDRPPPEHRRPTMSDR